VVARARRELRGRGVGEQAAAGDDDRAGAHRLDFLEDVGRQQDGAVTREFGDQPAHFVLLVRVEAVGGLVEDQRLGVVQDRRGQAHAAAEALRQRLDGLLPHAVERQALAHEAEPLLARVATQAAQVGDEPEEARGRHLAVARRALGQVAQAPARGERVGLHVVAADARGALGRHEEARDHAHRGGLAGAVGPEEAEHLAGLDLEADAVHGRERSVAFAQGEGLDHAWLGGIRDGDGTAAGAIGSAAGAVPNRAGRKRRGRTVARPRGGIT
jgi:hypothetical protein